MALPPVTFPTLGWVVIDWMEENLCNGPGDVQGEELVLDDEEVLFICWAYRIWPQGHRHEGRRMVHRAIYSRPKGRRKSMLAGAIAVAEALGPVRFGGWDEDGRPTGIPIKRPFIRCLATEEDQSANTYKNVVYMLEHGRVAEFYEFDVGRSAETSTRVILRELGGEVVPSTSGDASKDGGDETFAVADETHLYVDPRLRGMYRTVSRNTGKRKKAQPWILDTTTMFDVGERSIAEMAFDQYAGLDVEVCVAKHGVLLDHQQGDVPKKFGDDRSLIKAMKPGYGKAAPWIDFEAIVKIIRGAEDPEAEAFRYFLNRRRVKGSSWLAPEEVAAMLAELDVALGSKICGGFDGSENDDHTALMGCTAAGDLFTIGVWTPAVEQGLAWRRDATAAVDWLHENFEVVRFYADPAWWTSEVGEWAAKHGTVTEFWTGGRAEPKMAVATGACRTALRHGARIDPTPLYTPALRVVNDRVAPNAGTAGGVPLVQWHFQNARTRKVRIRVDPEREELEDAYLVRKERKGSPLKIDTVTAGILARRARDDAMKAGEFEEEAAGVFSWR